MDAMAWHKLGIVALGTFGGAGVGAILGYGLSWALDAVYARRGAFLGLLAIIWRLACYVVAVGILGAAAYLAASGWNAAREWLSE